MKKYLLLLGAVISLGSCSTPETPGASLLKRGSSSALVYNNCRAVSQEEVEFEFSRPVTIKYLNFEPELSVDSLENGSTVRVKFKEKQEAGKLIKVNLLAEDSKKNTLNVLVSFRTRNDRMPRLEINEVRTFYSKPTCEFIEFKMKTAGNLGAMRIYIASSDKEPMVFEFEPVEVKEGEYVVLHMRTLETELECVNEYGKNLAESGGTDSSPNARDFWVPSTKKILHNTDAIYVLNQDDIILDAIMFSETSDSLWQKDYLEKAADFLYSQNAWTAPDGTICKPEDAIDSKSVKTAGTRSISRDETKTNTHKATDWYITANSGATPGKPNNPNRLK